MDPPFANQDLREFILRSCVAKAFVPSFCLHRASTATEEQVRRSLVTHGGACGTADKLPNEATSRLVAPVRVQTVGLSLVSTINGFVSISQTLPLNIGLPAVFAKPRVASNCHCKPFQECVQLLTAVQVPRVGIPSKSGSTRERPRDLQVSSSTIN